MSSEQATADAAVVPHELGRIGSIIHNMVHVQVVGPEEVVAEVEPEQHVEGEPPVGPATGAVAVSAPPMPVPSAVAAVANAVPMEVCQSQCVQHRLPTRAMCSGLMQSLWFPA